MNRGTNIHTLQTQAGETSAPKVINPKSNGRRLGGETEEKAHEVTRRTSPIRVSETPVRALDTSEDDSKATAILNEVDRQNENIKRLSELVTEYDLTKYGLDQEVGLLQAQKAEVANKINELREDIAFRQARIQDEAEERKEFENTAQRLATEMQRVQERIESTTAELQALDEQRNAVKQQLEQTQRQLSSLRQQVENVKADVARTNTQIEEANNRIEIATNTVRDLDSTVEQFQGQVEVLNANIEHQTSNAEQVDQRLQELQQRLAETENQLRTLNSQCSELQTEIGNLERSRAELQGQIDQETREIERIRDEIGRNESEIARCQRELETFEELARRQQEEVNRLMQAETSARNEQQRYNNLAQGERARGDIHCAQVYERSAARHAESAASLRREIESKRANYQGQIAGLRSALSRLQTEHTRNNQSLASKTAELSTLNARINERRSQLQTKEARRQQVEQDQRNATRDINIHQTGIHSANWDAQTIRGNIDALGERKQHTLQSKRAAETELRRVQTDKATLESKRNEKQEQLTALNGQLLNQQDKVRSQEQQVSDVERKVALIGQDLTHAEAQKAEQTRMHQEIASHLENNRQCMALHRNREAVLQTDLAASLERQKRFAEKSRNQLDLEERLKKQLLGVDAAIQDVKRDRTLSERLQAQSRDQLLTMARRNNNNNNNNNNIITNRRPVVVDRQLLDR